MKSVIGYVCVFMAFIVICTFCGGIFGIAAGGTFSESVAGFGNTMNSIKVGLIDPFNDFMRFLGLSSTYGGDALVYRLEDDESDLRFSTLIPEGTYFAALVLFYNCTDKKVNSSVKNTYVVFFDLDGQPLSCIMLSSSASKDQIKPGELFMNNMYELKEIDCSRSYFNSFSKFLYFDIDVTYRLQYTDAYKTFSCYKNSALLEYKYAGDFTDLDRILSKVK